MERARRRSTNTWSSSALLLPADRLNDLKDAHIEAGRTIPKGDLGGGWAVPPGQVSERATERDWKSHTCRKGASRVPNPALSFGSDRRVCPRPPKAAR
jgi:hypothetical protein